MSILDDLITQNREKCHTQKYQKHGIFTILHKLTYIYTPNYVYNKGVGNFC